MIDLEQGWALKTLLTLRNKWMEKVTCFMIALYGISRLGVSMDDG